MKDLGEKQLGRSVKPKDFRHVRVTDLLRQRVPVTYVAEILGHKTLNSVLHYFNPTQKELREVLTL